MAYSSTIRNKAPLSWQRGEKQLQTACAFQGAVYHTPLHPTKDASSSDYSLSVNRHRHVISLVGRARHMMRPRLAGQCRAFPSNAGG